MPAEVIGPTQLRGVDLLDAAIARIRVDSANWDQGDWCGCLAAKVCEIAGGQWARAAILSEREMMVAEPGEPHALNATRGRTLVHVRYRSVRLIGFEFLTDLGTPEGPAAMLDPWLFFYGHDEIDLGILAAEARRLVTVSAGA